VSRVRERQSGAAQGRQAAGDRARAAAERNRLGQFTTPTPLARDMAALAVPLLPATGPVRFLDPAVGGGVFVQAAREALGTGRLASALGFEIDPALAGDARRLWGDSGLSVRAQDFCTARPPACDEDKATLLLCNPPYVRHHHLSSDHKAALRRELDEAGFRLSGLAGLYAYFQLLAHRWLAPAAAGVWITPAEFLHVNYGRALQEYLLRRVTLHRIHRFNPEEVQFGDALVSSVVVAFTNTPVPAGHRVQLSSGSHLHTPQVVHEVALADLDAGAKWGPLFTSPLRQRPGREPALMIGDLFSVKRGLATGAYEYFILERQRAQALALPAEYLRPILPGPRHIPGSCIERAPDGFPAGLPQLVLLDCDLPFEEVQRRHPGLAAYLRAGEVQGIPGRYLPAHRPLWYRQEQRPAAPILCTYMGRQNGGRAIRFIRNRSDATAPNVYLLLYPKARLASACRRDPLLMERVFGALTGVEEGLHAGGRVYGGGLNNIEPKELAAVELPQRVRIWLERHGAPVLRQVETGVTAE
jgi:hypothetical protein